MIQQTLHRISLCGLLCLGMAQPLLADSPSRPASAVKNSVSSSFQNLVNVYFDAFFARNPSWATYAGLHQHDHHLEDYTQAGIQAERAFAKAYLRRFEAIPAAELTPAEAIDREMLINSLRGLLLENETIRNWERNPDLYSSGITESIFTLMSRQFAPPRSAPARGHCTSAENSGGF